MYITFKVKEIFPSFIFRDQFNFELFDFKHTLVKSKIAYENKTKLFIIFDNEKPWYISYSLREYKKQAIENNKSFRMKRERKKNQLNMTKLRWNSCQFTFIPPSWTSSCCFFLTIHFGLSSLLHVNLHSFFFLFFHIQIISISIFFFHFI